ncbi:hypothetical protein A3F19_02875 [Candidatus Nomurabacteria bacterium RIFCSPHIGHO2_12_FULL_37_29]|uniref:Uncharacterized protein n=1 Tax=Candidatus Nomurabacteria bacterium RIFCSPHIGHO2_12_FULL_37_29 TaxID=1801759 RepID=A0A1F6WB31_9BACT|nr:MAG: hypothetical protein A3F19_02875 [Candidatus Nomurabacteria bacterium RIFCSPHIGHO2_12_FULL_37_29]OGI84382.1 MAG: hypothetical protein A3A92_01710 [Candidatus Nomurabacteria bacterium RIFCSPLOWO2_01_FULL_37_49]
MINLIPKEEKKKKVKVFYYKLVFLFLVMVNLITFFSLVAILPSYFSSSVRHNIVNAKRENQKNKPEPLTDQQTLAVIKDLNKKLNLMEHVVDNKFIISEKIINAIILKKMSNIKITDISYENDPLKGRKVSIEGNAPSREILLLFRRALEDDVLFKQVDLPISNFVKGSDIKFYLNLIPS